MPPKSLRVLIDARPIVDPRGGGVRRVSEQIVQSILYSDLNAEWYFVTTGSKKPILPEWLLAYFEDSTGLSGLDADRGKTEQQATRTPYCRSPEAFAKGRSGGFNEGMRQTRKSCHHIHLKWPNKLWSLAAMFGAVAFDREAAKFLPTEDDRPKKFDKAIILNLGFTGFLETPYAILLHDLSFVINPEWFSLKSRIWHIAVNPKEMIRRAAQLFSVSETTARDAARIFNVPLKEIEIVKPGVRRETSDVRHEKNQGDLTSHVSHLTPSPYALVLGNGNPRKNVPTIIKAFEILKRDPEFTNLDLVIVGEKSRVKNSHAPRTTHRAPSDMELDELYANASMFLYPSWYEGYGLPLHEAARFTIPCIASTDGALPETAPEGTLFVPPSKPHLWANAIRDVVASPDQYRTLFDAEVEKPNFASLIHWLGR